MNFEPQKFFIGLVDFFSVILPGALLVYLYKEGIMFPLKQETAVHFDGSEAWMVFFFASYLSGHLVFLLGSKIDILYDMIKDCTYFGQIEKRLAKGKHLSLRFFRKLAENKILFGKNPDGALMQAIRIKSRAWGTLSAENAVNAFQWCKVRLSKENPEGLAEVRRFEANSKFFRSFIVVLAVLAVIFVSQFRFVLLAICLGLMLLAFWRYADQRFKATQKAYWLVIDLESMKEQSNKDYPARSDGLTHAGGVVFRKQGETIEYMLVQASKNRNELVLPKGHIEPGENTRETAVREVKEESGNWARVIEWIDDKPLGKDPDAPFVRFFLMELEEEEEKWNTENRQREWIREWSSLKEQTEINKEKTKIYPETIELLNKAYELRKQICEKKQGQRSALKNRRKRPWRKD